jgi:DNA polymerase-3 subunit epsilon
VTDTVTKKTSLLVVGDQDIRLLNGHEKSTKQRKAEQLIAEGQEIRILSESDYILLLKRVVEIARLTHAASPPPQG